jgi:bacteriocin-associated integral membrane protein
MKWIIVALLILLSATAAATEYVNTDNAQRQAVQHAAVVVGQPFKIPSDPRIEDPETTYAAIRSAADDARVNVFRTAVGYTTDDRPQVTQYALLSTDTRLFDAFEIRDGRWLAPEDTDHPERFLATVATGDPDQVGLLGDFGGNDLVFVRGLRTAFDSLPVAATYVVEASDQASFDRFMNSLAQGLSKVGDGTAGFTAATFESDGGRFAGYTTGFAPVLSGVQFLIVFFTALFLAFQVLHEAKKAGVMKLHGHGAIDVWFALAGRLILITVAASLATALAASRLIPGATADFTISVGSAIVRTFAVMLAASLVACAYIARARISDTIKNRKDTRGVFVLNTLVKVGCSVLLTAVGAGLWLQYANAANEREKLGNWERARGYGIFYPASVGNDLIELQTGGLATTEAEVHELYPVLNTRGALYIDASPYGRGAQARPLPPGSYRSIEVNVNYLKQFPLVDVSGRTIEISEDTSDWIVLVPIRLRDHELEIRDYFQLRRTGSQGVQGVVQADEAMFDRPAPPQVAKQGISIIWLQDGQTVFSFDPQVNPNDGNVIIGPIVEVMTTANSVGVDRLNMVTGGGSTALKMHLVEGDTVRTLDDLAPTLRLLKLDDNLRNLVTMDEYVSQQIARLDEGLRSILIAGVAILVGLLVLTVQSALILFERYSRRITIRRLFGAGFMRTYREPLAILGAIWSVQVIGALVANRLGLNPFSTSTSASVADDRIVLAIAVAVVLAEWLFSSTVLTFVEKRGLVRVLKQEF